MSIRTTYIVRRYNATQTEAVDVKAMTSRKNAIGRARKANQFIKDALLATVHERIESNEGFNAIEPTYHVLTEKQIYEADFTQPTPARVVEGEVNGIGANAGSLAFAGFLY